MRFLLALATPRVADLFQALEAGGFSVDVVPGDRHEPDPDDERIVFAPLPAELPAGDEGPQHLLVGDLFVDVPARTAHRGARTIELGRREFDLLACFARYRNRSSYETRCARFHGATCRFRRTRSRCTSARYAASSTN